MARDEGIRRARAGRDRDEDLQPDDGGRRPRPRRARGSDARSRRACAASGSSGSPSTSPTPSTPMCLRRRRCPCSTSSSAAEVVGAVGASNFTGEQLAEALELSALEGLTRYEWVQNAFSLLEQGDRGDRLPPLPRARARLHAVQPARRRVADGQVPARRAAAAGLADDRPPGGRREATARTRLRRARGARAGVGASAGPRWPALALAWLLHTPEITAVVVGPTHGRAARARPRGARDQLSTTTSGRGSEALQVSVLVLSDARRPRPARHGVVHRCDGGRARRSRARRALDAAPVRVPAARRSSSSA